MFQEGLSFDTLGRVIIVGYFLVAGLSNLVTARRLEHIQRLGTQGIPSPTAAFWFALAIQFTGCALIATNWYASVGVWCLIAFTITASAIFHRFWNVTDPMRRNMMRVSLLSNTGTVGGLFLLLQNVCS